MRVLYLNYEWDLRDASGAATHIRELTRGLESLGHTVIVRDRHRAGARSSAMSAQKGGASRALRRRLRPYLHEWAALARSMAGVRTELELIRQEHPDIVLTRHSLHQFSSLLAARRADVPIVFEVNAPLGFEYRRYRRHEYHLLPGFAEWTEARTLASAHGVFVVSSPLKTHLVQRGVPVERVSVVPNGADPERFRPDAADRAIRARCGAQRLLVGFVGSFAGFHGVEMLRHAIAEVLPTRPNVAFVMVGQGPGVAVLEDYCRQHGLADRVVFLGFIPPAQVPGAMAAMDVLLAPYAVDDFFYFSSLKLFEYMASGRAVVAPRVGQLAEVIEDGINGLLYDGTSPESFARQIVRLVDDAVLRARLGAHARRTIETGYTWRINAERVGAVLEQARRRHLEQS